MPARWRRARPSPRREAIDHLNGRLLAIVGGCGRALREERENGLMLTAPGEEALEEGYFGR